MTGDLGYGLWDAIKSEFPLRYINCRASEQAMLDIAVGIALEGNIPFVYSITPFLLYRPFEAIRIYLNHEKIPVKLVGSGRNGDYAASGFTHYCGGDRTVMKLFPNIKSYWPTKEELPSLIDEVVYNNQPSYINLKT